MCPSVALGSSGLRVGRVGLGTVKLGRTAGLKYPGPVSIPDDDAALELLRTARELGVNLVDTAPAYGLSESRLGELLPRVAPRKAWVISTKAGEWFDPAAAGGRGASHYDFAPAAIRVSVERSLARLKVDAVDLAMLHFGAGFDDEEEVVRRGEAMAALHALKQAGKVRAVGASCAKPAAARAALAQTGAGRPDVLMLALSTAERDLVPVIADAARDGLGVLIKKPLGSGHLDPCTSLNFVFGHAGVHAAVLGTTSPAHLREAVEIVAAATPGA